MSDVKLLGETKFIVEGKLNLTCYSCEVNFPLDIALFIILEAVL